MRSGMKMVRSVKQIERHRNGVAGEPFYAVLFNSTHGGIGDKAGSLLMLATVFDTPGTCAVLRVTPLSDPKVGVTFGVNSWRGDAYEDELRAAIAAWEAERAAELSAPRPLSEVGK